MGKLLGLFCLGLAACATGPVPATDYQGHRATLWATQSAERGAITRQTYRAALKAVDEALANPRWTALLAQSNFSGLASLKTAVLLDIDDTVIDTGPYQAQNLAEHRAFPDGWDHWLATADATAIPGTAAFFAALEKRRVTPVFITNRTCAKRPDSLLDCPQEGDTIRALAAIGVPGPIAGKNVLLKGEESDWGTDKLTRRLTLVNRYRVLVIIGDDLADFLPAIHHATPQQRRNAVKRFEHLWGDRWFLLPNPVYGSFLDTNGPTGPARPAVGGPAVGVSVRGDGQ